MDLSADLSLLLCAGMRTLDGEYKLSKNIKIAMLYLEDDDAVKAEMFIKKASALIANCKVNGSESTCIANSDGVLISAAQSAEFC